MKQTKQVSARLEYLRGEIEAERISYGEIAELQSLREYIADDDTLLLQWADVPEGLPVKHCAEYDAAAEHYAKHGELPNLMATTGALHWINKDPEAFMDRVRQFKYANAMEATQ